MCNIWIRLKEGDESGSEFWEFVSQLEGEGGEDEVQVAAVLEVAGTEERRSELTVSKDPLADCLGDRGLAGPGEPVQPEDGRLIEVFGPCLDLVQHSLSCPSETTAAITMTMLRSLCAAAAVQH